MNNCKCCQSEEIKRRGFYRNRTLMCNALNAWCCGASFSEKQPLNGLRAPMDKVIQTVHLLCEGMGIRAIERFIDLNRETVLNILEMAGQKAMALLDQQVRNIEVESIQCDEIFSFVLKKEFNKSRKQPRNRHTIHSSAVDRKSKLIRLSLCRKAHPRVRRGVYG